ncbi:serine/threonine-protein kinase [Rubinisphaera sp. JC750]|uniref:serine/threonine-protein kinase n=1 Tax=Rubinisphaera sp. JC750 TaxID=2898658 RepID=UPI001F010811|nr:serine/threonine-protein kinase [Rubinisphaera sp. JC750]
MSQANTPLSSFEIAERVDALCDRFEQAWDADNRPRMEDFLDGLDEKLQQAALWELIALELDLRRDCGETPGKSEYEQRFPQWKTIVSNVFVELETLLSLSKETFTAEGNVEPAARQTLIEFSGTDRYELLEKLGQGGFGRVYKVFDHTYREHCALKLLLVPEAGSLYRFKREFRTLAGLHHRNLISLRELICDQGQWFFTMELVEGLPLTRYLRNRPEEHGSQAWFDQLANIFLQMVEGVAALHAAGFVHRDLKPANVLVNAEGRVIILDLGLVSGVKGDQPDWQQSREDGVAGTVAYMSPEQLAEQVIPACDCYAIGVMLFECLVGRLPFSGSVWQIVQDKQREAAPSPGEIAPELPDHWVTLCDRLLERDADRRLTLHEVKAALQNRPASKESPSTQVDPEMLLIGRDEQLAWLKDEFTQMTQTGPRQALVHGASGIGKTALTQRFLRDVSQQSEVVILSSRCYERESVPFKALDGIMDALSRYLNKCSPEEIARLLPRHVAELARLFPTLQRIDTIARETQRLPAVSDQQELRRRAIEALRQMLATLGDRCQLILAFDDLQWGDVDSIRLLRTILDTADPPRLLLLGTYRSEERDRSPCLQTLLAGEGGKTPLSERELTELTPDDCAQLARELFGKEGLDEQSAARLARESHGSPFFLQELIAYASADDTGPTSLDAAILNRVHRLPEDQQRLLQMIAINGQPIATRDALEAAEVGFSDLEQLRGGHLVRTSGLSRSDFVEPYHDRIRESVAASLSEDQSKRAYRRLAETLETREQTEPHILASHWRAVGNLPRAAGYFERAAAEAMRKLAFNQAARLFQQQAECLAEPTREQQQTIAANIAQAYASDGQGIQAAEYFQQAAEFTDEAEQAFEYRRLAMARLFQVGSLDEAFVLLRELLTDVDVGYPESMSEVVRGIVGERALQSPGIRQLMSFRGQGTDRATLAKRIRTCWAAAQTLSILDPVRGYYFQMVGERTAARAPDLDEAVQLRAYGACLKAASGKRRDIAAAQKTFADIRANAALNSSVYLETFVSMCEGVTDYLLSNFPQSIARCRQAMHDFQTQCPGAWWEADLSRTFAIFSSNFSGNIESLQELTAVDEFTLQKRKTTFYTIMVRADAEIVLQIAADDLSAATQRTEQLASLLNFEEFNNLHFNYYLRRFWELRYAQAGRECWQLTREIEKGYKASLLSAHHWARASYHMNRGLAGVLALLETPGTVGIGNTVEISKDVQRQIARLRREQKPFCDVQAELLTAGLATLADPRKAIAPLHKALKHSKAAELQLFEAVCLDRLHRLKAVPAGIDASAVCETYISTQGLANPERFFDVFAPGKWA